MGKKWDYDVPGVEVWAECLRVLKPGGHLLAFAGTRTQHRMAVRIEDAGFEIRDMIAWVYGSGFPKSLDVSKAIDKNYGENRDRQLRFTAWMRSTGITAEQINEATQSCMASHYLTDKSQPAIATADMFDKLRPYLPEVPEYIERLVCERTGLEWTAYKNREVVGTKTAGMGSGNTFGMLQSEGDNASANKTLDITAPSTDAAKQWQGWGTALKPALEPITVARKPLIGTVAENVLQHGTGAINVDGGRVGTEEIIDFKRKENSITASGWKDVNRNPYEQHSQGRWPANFIHDGSEEVTDLLKDSARFFYCAKTSKRDRDEGNNHPTVKPTDLMRYLCRLVTPPDGLVLDPFMGSGSTGKAAVLEGFRFIGIEREAEYVAIAQARINHFTND
jgi:site-specific DNA-methyltransferase (adenine-specific)